MTILQKFYSDHDTATFINADKIHPSYQEFVCEILPKYIYYYLQCELIWFEESYSKYILLCRYFI